MRHGAPPRAHQENDLEGFNSRHGILTIPEIYCRRQAFHIAKSLEKGEMNFRYQMKNRTTTQAMRSIIAEYFRPEIASPSPIWPATRPEKNPWIIAAWEKSRL